MKQVNLLDHLGQYTSVWTINLQLTKMLCSPEVIISSSFRLDTVPTQFVGVCMSQQNIIQSWVLELLLSALDLRTKLYMILRFQTLSLSS